MARRQNAKVNTRASRTKQLLKEARAQPGVAAVMEVYRAYRRVESAARPYLRAVESRSVISASNTSCPNRW